MIPGLIKSEELMVEMKKYFAIKESVFIGFNSEKFTSTWYDGTIFRVDPVFSARVLCGIIDPTSSVISTTNCLTPHSFICQKSNYFSDENTNIGTKNN
jgi:hypothetical protein